MTEAGKFFEGEGGAGARGLGGVDPPLLMVAVVVECFNQLCEFILEPLRSLPQQRWDHLAIFGIDFGFFRQG